MVVANNLAYYDTAIITALKSFIVQATGVNALKTFSSSMLLRHNKLECLNLVILYCLV